MTKMTNEESRSILLRLPVTWLKKIDRRVVEVKERDPFATRSSVIRHWISEKLVMTPDAGE